MSELVILGSGSGFATKDRFSTSIALLVEPNLYLFDCGEPSAALLFRHGIDALALNALFVSHMHPDHIGGLAGLLSSISLAARNSKAKFRPWSVNRNDPWYRAALSFPKRPLNAQTVEETRPLVRLVMPSEAIAAIQTYLIALGFSLCNGPFDLQFSAVDEGITFLDQFVKVTAVANSHNSANPLYAHLKVYHPHLALQSYSFAVETERTKFVYSGDITTLNELNPLLQGAQLLIVEVAHYDPQDIGPFVRDLPLERIVLTHVHPGLEDRLLELVNRWADPRIEIAYDGMRVPPSNQKESNAKESNS
jgi:ribonuclease BN (tRNA processing enzyme)